MIQIKYLWYLYFTEYILKSDVDLSFSNVSIYNLPDITFFENI